MFELGWFTHQLESHSPLKLIRGRVKGFNLLPFFPIQGYLLRFGIWIPRKTYNKTNSEEVLVLLMAEIPNNHLGWC